MRYGLGGGHFVVRSMEDGKEREPLVRGGGREPWVEGGDRAVGGSSEGEGEGERARERYCRVVT